MNECGSNLRTSECASMGATQQPVEALRDKLDALIAGAGRIRELASLLEERLFIVTPTNGDKNVQPCSVDGQTTYLPCSVDGQTTSLASILIETENILASVLRRV